MRLYIPTLYWIWEFSHIVNCVPLCSVIFKTWVYPQWGFFLPWIWNTLQSSLFVYLLFDFCFRQAAEWYYQWGQVFTLTFWLGAEGVAWFFPDHAGSSKSIHRVNLNFLFLVRLFFFIPKDLEIDKFTLSLPGDSNPGNFHPNSYAILVQRE